MEIVKMLIQEFTQRTGYQPTEKEFEAIHKIYMATDDDKTTFCINWKKINSRLVRWQKKAIAAKNQTLEKLWAEYNELVDKRNLMMRDPQINFIDGFYSRYIQLGKRQDAILNLIEIINK
ncbi:MAG: hypothetical protein IKH61_12955 [Bacteroidales bacterium]|nr:hypothetical protein [Bacteroidales bacterium]